MKVGIIGSGNIGSTLVRKLTTLGHEVSVANSRGPETLQQLADDTGAQAVNTQEAVRGSDVVIVAIPEGRVRELPRDLFVDASEDLVIIDTGNYYPNGNTEYGREADGLIKEIEGGLPESAWVERQFGHSVVKAFNTIVANDIMHLGKPKGDPSRVALPVAGNKPDAKRIVMLLIDDLGFDAVDAGSLEESWRQQPGSPVYVANLRLEDLKRGLAEAKPERTPMWMAGDN